MQFSFGHLKGFACLGQILPILFYQDGKGFMFLTAAIIIVLVIIVNLYIRKPEGKVASLTNSLEERYDFLQAALNSLAEGVVVTDAEGIVIFVNQVARRRSGLAGEEIIGKHFTHVLKFKHESTAKPIVIPYKDIMEKQYTLRKENEVVLEFADGCYLYAGFSVAPILGTKVLPAGIVIVFWDVSAQREVKQALADSEAKFRGIFEVVNDAIILTTLDGLIVDANPASTKMFLYTHKQLIGMHVQELIKESHSQEVEKNLEAVSDYEDLVFPADAKRKDGTLFSAEISMRICTIGREKHVVIVARNVTERKKYEEAIRRQALHDPLTDLPNRLLFAERVQNAIIRARRNNYKAAVMFLDIDYFKNVNDNYGHSIGDVLLKEVGRRLIDSLREEDTVARLGGDEFAILLPQINKASDAGKVAEKIRQEIQLPWNIHGFEISITLSIGIALYPDHGQEVDELIQKADQAMYRVKLAGKNNYKFFAEETVNQELIC